MATAGGRPKSSGSKVPFAIYKQKVKKVVAQLSAYVAGPAGAPPPAAAFDTFLQQELVARNGSANRLFALALARAGSNPASDDKPGFKVQDEHGELRLQIYTCCMHPSRVVRSWAQGLVKKQHATADAEDRKVRSSEQFARLSKVFELIQDSLLAADFAEQGAFERAMQAGSSSVSKEEMRYELRSFWNGIKVLVAQLHDDIVSGKGGLMDHFPQMPDIIINQIEVSSRVFRQACELLTRLLKGAGHKFWLGSTFQPRMLWSRLQEEMRNSAKVHLQLAILKIFHPFIASLRYYSEQEVGPIMTSVLTFVLGDICGTHSGVKGLLRFEGFKVVLALMADYFAARRPGCCLTAVDHWAHIVVQLACAANIAGEHADADAIQQIRETLAPELQPLQDKQIGALQSSALSAGPPRDSPRETAGKLL